MKKNATRSWWVFVVAIVFAGVVAGGVLGSWASRNGYPLFTSGVLTPTLASDTVPAAPASTGPLPDSFASIIQPDLPSVVYISTTTVVNRPTYNSPFFNDPFFRQFFGPQAGPTVPQKQHALGSGFIIRPDGVILTNNHVVRGATDIRVTLSDKREFKAKVLGTDPRTDLAVLKIDTTGLTPLQLGNSSQLRVGDIVFAIGDPFGVGETVTMGIISAKGRSNVSIEGPQSIQDFIQTDAAINPGNSGGPLINTRGQVIGIDTAIVTGGSQGNIGIGFAIPSDLARNVMNQLIAHGKVIRGQLGVNISNVDAVMAKQFGLPKTEGVIVDSVEPDSAAAKAGIERGDIILKFNGEPVSSMNDLVLQVTQVPPGTKVNVEIFRNGKTLNVSPVLEEASAAKGAEQSSNAGQGSALQGVQVQTLTPQIAGQLNLSPDTYGVVVASVDPNSPAANSLERGDVIQEINRKRVSNVTGYAQLLRQAGDQPVLLLVNRGGQTIFVSISPNGE
ncbi:MAG TPA: DegQ family serine endoprotease [Patescibacteria group bacterium]|nr:DegQ family serine endoprotease [Patescibacteria group bacterium]